MTEAMAANERLLTRQELAAALLRFPLRTAGRVKRFPCLTEFVKCRCRDRIRNKNSVLREKVRESGKFSLVALHRRVTNSL